MTTISSGISLAPLPFYWSDLSDQKLFSQKENEVTRHLTDGYDGDILEFTSSVQKAAAPYDIYCALEGRMCAPQKENGSQISSEFAGLTPLALLYAIYARITEANRKLQLSWVQGLEQIHQAEEQIERERLDLYERQVQKFFEAQEKARNGEIVNIAFDWVNSVVDIVAGLSGLSIGMASGFEFEAAGGAALLLAGLIGCGNALLETIAFCSNDKMFAEQLKEYSVSARSAQTYCELLGFSISGMRAAYKRWESGNQISRAVEDSVKNARSTIQNSVANITREAGSMVAEIGSEASMIEALGQSAQEAQRTVENWMKEEISRSIFNALKTQGWGRLTREQVAASVERVLAEGVQTSNQLVSELQRQLRKSALTERMLELISGSMQHLYIIANVASQTLQVLRTIVNGVIGHEIAKSEAQGKELEAKGEFLKTLTSIQRERINWLLKQEKENATRIVNDQGALLQNSRMLNQNALRVVNALARAV